MADIASTSTFSQRRIRHITSIQIRNLTAFPVRDAFASALSQPAEQPQFNAPGYFSDDLDVTLSRKRSRRISANSIATYKSFKSDESAGEDVGHVALESRGRRQTGSRLSFHGGGSVGSSPSVRFHSGSAPTVRGHRPRTSSMTSSLNVSAQTSTGLPGSTIPPSIAPFIASLPDHSQTGLEKVIKARLFETFLAVSIEPPSPNEVDGQPVPVVPPSPVLSGPSTPPRSPKLTNGVSLRKGTKPSPLSPTEKALTSARRNIPTPPGSPSKHIPKSPSTSALKSNGKMPQLPRKSPTARMPSPAPRSPSPSSPTLPDYLSPVHRPSTNPSFAIDTRTWCQSSLRTDWSGRKLMIELWGKVGDGLRSPVPVPGKGKEKAEALDDTEAGEDDWRVLEKWDLDLEHLMPLTEDQEVPSNTLVIKLQPLGRTFYLPSSLNLARRPPTPSADIGYASDPESGGRPAKKGDDPAAVQFSPEIRGVDVIALSRRRHRRGAGAPDSEQDRVKTASWQDLFKLVTLQTCIQDNEVSLSEIVREIDRMLEGDATRLLKREVSERESLVQGLRKNLALVYDQSELLKENIELRRQQLQERKEMLALAQDLRDGDLSSAEETEEQVSDARAELLSLRNRFTPTRTTLISSLSTIFPIELLFSPDLLYTILDVPLPIPLSAADPAPPLSLPAHKDVTEDAVATALGYVAQVVQLLAAYLGKGLVYPITCIGSRSMIRDGISAMVGPRMFPLFSKGVDTYRFEYGVFLLNKDIELLMADRDLRALDMRHTLPNLKNLLLTLTDGEGVQLSAQRSFESPELSITDLESPRAQSPVENGPGSTTPKAEVSAELPAEGNTPPASGATTPTTETAKKSVSRSFIGLSPIAGFLRARYPSAIRAAPTKPVSEADGEAPTVEEEQQEDEEDRRTIRGDVGTDAGLEETGKGANGVDRGTEKSTGVAYTTHPPPPAVK
ncbi:UV radiation resistance protein and autophagy-related subunit 14-domain-containing protein [Mycena pura]|uniref:Autophagy-related protein 14 n=1 Tax=Mycena pura TaxID=153505 RepID=A0AAD6YQJ0_9AGAR|nr:UV radiation resistance protein and autophagy-related subunit 14-domain-containing protein [Mycena pura]